MTRYIVLKLDGGFADGKGSPAFQVAEYVPDPTGIGEQGYYQTSTARENHPTSLAGARLRIQQWIENAHLNTEVRKLMEDS